MNWFIDYIKKYADFSGRAHRTEYWMYILFYIIFLIIVTTIDVLTGVGVLYFIYSLALLVPSITVGAIRLHDINRSGWWQLIMLVPLIGVIVLIIFFATDSEGGENRFGPSPK